MPRIKHLFFIGLLGLFSTAFAAPKVVVTISPIHALTEAVMQGVTEPVLLVAPGASPHSYALKPSQVSDLHQADLVIWVGESLETFLIKTITQLPKNTQTLTLLTTPGLDPLPMRTAANFGGNDHHDHAHTGFDPHIWLDPIRSQKIVLAIATALSEVDASNKAKYLANAKQLNQQIDQLHQQLLTTFKPLHQQPFIVFHDAYQYLAQRYALNAIGAIALNPEIMPSAQHVAAIQNMIKEYKVVCIFSEPQFKPAIVDMIAQGTGTRVGVLNPEGITGFGFTAYQNLLTGLAKSLHTCLLPDTAAVNLSL